MATRGCRPTQLTLYCTNASLSATLTTAILRLVASNAAHISLLGSPRLTEPLAASTTACAPHLQHLVLELPDSVSTKGADHFLAALAPGRTLRGLELRVGPRGGVPVLGLEACTGLEELRLQMDMLPKTPLRALCTRGDEAPPAVEAIATLVGLRSLEVYGSAMGRLMDPPHRLRGLCALTSLTRLRLGLPTGFGDPGTRLDGVANPLGWTADAEAQAVAVAEARWRLVPVAPCIDHLAELHLGRWYDCTVYDMAVLSRAAQLTCLACRNIVVEYGWLARPRPQTERERVGEGDLHLGAGGMAWAAVPMPPRLRELQVRHLPCVPVLARLECLPSFASLKCRQVAKAAAAAARSAAAAAAASQSASDNATGGGSAAAAAAVVVPAIEPPAAEVPTQSVGYADAALITAAMAPTSTSTWTSPLPPSSTGPASVSAPSGLPGQAPLAGLPPASIPAPGLTAAPLWLQPPPPPPPPNALSGEGVAKLVLLATSCKIGSMEVPAEPWVADAALAAFRLLARLSQPHSAQHPAGSGRPEPALPSSTVDAAAASAVSSNRTPAFTPSQRATEELLRPLRLSPVATSAVCEAATKTVEARSLGPPLDLPPAWSIRPCGGQGYLSGPLTGAWLSALAALQPAGVAALELWCFAFEPGDLTLLRVALPDLRELQLYDSSAPDDDVTDIWRWLRRPGWGGVLRSNLHRELLISAEEADTVAAKDGEAAVPGTEGDRMI